MRLKSTLIVIAMWLTVAGTPSVSSADSIIIDMGGGNGTGSQSGSTFTYDLYLTPANRLLSSGDFFTLFDFQGLSSVTFTGGISSDFALSTPNVTPGVLHVPTVLLDHGALPNILLTYTGAPVQAASLRLFLGTITAVTSMTTFGVVTDKYVGDYTTAEFGTDQNIGDAIVPFSASGPFLPLPPAVLGGVALMGLVAAGRRRTATES